MPTQMNLVQLTISVFLVIFIYFIQCNKSQTDTSSFGIFASSDIAPTGSCAVRLLLSWNTEQWECIINETIGQLSKYYMCTSGDLEPNATLINNTLPSNAYQMRIELIADNIDNLIRIDKIRVVDDDVNYYDIDTFCLPSQFQHTSARGTILQRLECCYWSQRYSYNNYAMGSKQNAVLTISYAQFRSNVLNYPNEAHEGAIKPPMITEVSISTLDIESAESSTNYSLTLHWDTEEYSWSIEPNQWNRSYMKTFSDNNTFCEFSSGFSLEMTGSSDDSLGLNEIVIKDESGYYYNMDMFCLSDQTDDWQRYNNSGKQCDDEWSQYTMYYGFIYNGTAPIYFVWDETVFFNVDKKQQGIVIHDNHFSGYSCDSNDDVLVLTPTAFTLFKDNMDDPISTGWIFQGTYRDNLNAVNCIGGSGDKCARLAGYEATTTIDSSMQITINVSDYVNMMDITVQYSLSLSAMPSGKSCYVSYAIDGGSFSTGKTHVSSGPTLQTFLNQSFAIPDHTEFKYKSLTIRFLNNALYDNEYCYIDDLYVFVGDTAIEVDYCEALDSSWTYYGADIQTASICHRSSCIYLTSSGWASKTFTDIGRYNNLKLRADMKTDSKINIFYSYDNEAESLLTTRGGNCCALRTYTNVEFSIPGSEICGADDTLTIRFASSGSSCTVDNLVLFGNLLDTAFPSTLPTQIPTSFTQTPTRRYPTNTPTFGPTFYPSIDPTISPTKQPTVQTSNPTMNPTIHPSIQPTINPTIIPTIYPTMNPTTANPTINPTMNPTIDPTLKPTINPTIDPTMSPTINPTMHPTSPSRNPTSNPTFYPTYDPTSNPTYNPTYDPTYDPTSNPTYNPTLYPTYYPTSNPTSNPTFYPTYDPTSNPTIHPTSPSHNPTSNPTVDPTYDPTYNPTFYPTYDPSSNPATVSVQNQTIDEDGIFPDNDRATKPDDDSINTVAVVLIVVAILVVLLVLVIIYVLYQNRTLINNIHQQRDNNDIQHVPIGMNKNDGSQHEGNEIEMAQSINKTHDTNTLIGDTLGKDTTDDGGMDIHNIAERQKKIKVWFENHVKLNESNNKYYSLFMLNGYDELSLIAEITNTQLIEMGIDKMAHRNRILKAIEIIDTDYIAH